jgi:hypothetical protein
LKYICDLQVLLHHSWPQITVVMVLSVSMSFHGNPEAQCLYFCPDLWVPLPDPSFDVPLTFAAGSTVEPVDKATLC